MYQFSISTQLLGRQKISGRGSRRAGEQWSSNGVAGEQWKKSNGRKGKRISREKYLSKFCFVSGNIDFSINICSEVVI